MRIIKDLVNESLRMYPKVEVVKLVAAGTGDEVLTVDPYSGRIYFKRFQPDALELDGKNLARIKSGVKMSPFNDRSHLVS